MNFLAHLYLAQPNIPSRVGNLLGDFAKGLDSSQLSPAVAAGLRNHRAVDLFTDRHPLVGEMKACFSPQRRRFSGIALDVLFDHFLLQHWQRYCVQPKQQFITEIYEDLLAGQSLMPEVMQRTTLRIVEQNWFASYETVEGVGFALDRIAARIRFQNRFSGVEEELISHYDRFEGGFLEFFPQLLAEVRRRGEES
ncbi:MAG: ACP phosphodiesterase [Amphritea sp.]